MTTMRLQRFGHQHLRDFRGPITVKAMPEAVVEEVVEAPPAPTFSEADIEHARAAAKKIGYAEGFEAGLLQATNEQTAREKDTAHAISQIREQLGKLASRYQQLVNQQSAELSDLVLMIARKVAGEALTSHGTDTLAALVERCLPVIFGKPRVTVELASATLTAAQPILTDQLLKGGFEGDIQFRANDTLGAHDMRLDWGQGEATRSTAALWQEIEALLQQVSLTPTLPREVTNAPTQETNHG